MQGRCHVISGWRVRFQFEIFWTQGLTVPNRRNGVSSRVLWCPHGSSRTRIGSSSCPPVTSCIRLVPWIGDTAVTSRGSETDSRSPEQAITDRKLWDSNSQWGVATSRGEDRLDFRNAGTRGPTSACDLVARANAPRSHGRTGGSLRRRLQTRDVYGEPNPAKREPPDIQSLSSPSNPISQWTP